MNSPHIMSTQPLQPSPFAPDQFLAANPSHDEDIHGFIKKRPIELTEDLIEGRLEYRLRRCRSPHRAFSEPPDFGFAMHDANPMTPPNRAQSPVAREADRLRHHPSSSRRKPSTRRPSKVRRSCTGLPSRKPSTRESSPAFAPRSPLGRWTPPALSSMPVFAPDEPMLPSTPPPRPQSSYPFGVLPPHCWASRVPWTVPSPSTSPYPDHSPQLDSEHPA